MRNRLARMTVGNDKQLQTMRTIPKLIITEVGETENVRDKGHDTQQYNQELHNVKLCM